MKFKRASKCGLALALGACLCLSPVTAEYAPAATLAETNAAADYVNTWTNTGDQATDIVKIALTQVGYVETPTNITKYNTWYYGQSTEAAWCSIFISWCANQASISSSILPKAARASGFSTSNMSSNPFGGTAIAFSTGSVKVGDILYIDNSSDEVSDHTGLVYSVDSDYIYAVEGNSSDKVNAVKYDTATGHRNGTSASHIVFSARPAYSSSSKQTTVSTSSESGTSYTVTASSLNVRSGPGTDYSVIGSLKANDQITVYEISNGWGRISYSGKTGWISLKWAVSDTASTGSTSEAAVTADTGSTLSTGEQYTITASSLTIRSGAGTSNTALGSIPKGTEVTVTETATDSSGESWGKTTYNNVTGWICLKYASKSSSASGSSTTSSSSQSTSSTGSSLGEQYTITARNLTIRSGAGTSYAALSSVSKGEVVTVTETRTASDNTTWGKITSGTVTGWICMSYTQKVTTSTGTTSADSTTTGSSTSTGSSASTGSTASSSGVTYIVNVRALNVRSGPGTSYTALTSLPNGTSVTVLETSGDWGKIQNGSSYGWILLSYCKQQ